MWCHLGIDRGMAPFFWPKRLGANQFGPAKHFMIRCELEVLIMTTKSQVTTEDLYHVPDNGKAEIVKGQLVVVAPTGFLPNRASFNITASLREYEHRTKSGFAFADNACFRVNLLHLESL